MLYTRFYCIFYSTVNLYKGRREKNIFNGDRHTQWTFQQGFLLSITKWLIANRKITKCDCLKWIIKITHVEEMRKEEEAKKDTTNAERWIARLSTSVNFFVKWMISSVFTKVWWIAVKWISAYDAFSYKCGLNAVVNL